jgi:hypothetical protein
MPRASLPAETTDAVHFMARSLRREVYEDLTSTPTRLGSVPVTVGRKSARFSIFLVASDDMPSFDVTTREILIPTKYEHFGAFRGEFAALALHELSHARDALVDPVFAYYAKDKEDTFLAAKGLLGTIANERHAHFDGYDRFPRDKRAAALAFAALKDPRLLALFRARGVEEKKDRIGFTIAAWRAIMVEDAMYLMGGMFGEESADEARRGYTNAETEIRSHAVQIFQNLVEERRVTAAREASTAGPGSPSMGRAFMEAVEKDPVWKETARYMTAASKRRILLSLGASAAAATTRTDDLITSFEKKEGVRLTDAEKLKVRYFRRLWRENPQKLLAIAKTGRKEDSIALLAFNYGRKAAEEAGRLLGELQSICGK